MATRYGAYTERWSSSTASDREDRGSTQSPM